MKNLFTIISLAILFGTSATFAQDKIYKKSGEVLETKVIEIGTSEIRYKAFANLNGPNYVVNKQDVIKIIYENGKVETFENVAKEIAIETQKRAQNVYAEILGQGLLFSVNYDTRFSNKRTGLGGRVGFGGIGGGGESFITVPVSLNYLLGDGKNLFEIGLGATYASLATNDDFLFGDGGSTVLGTMAFMYRLQPIKSGFSFRGGITPFFSSEVFVPYYVGFSLGYTF
ncbi:hypothetical protein [Pedobacter psychrophilus]|nr:hypothetical protein [Pedobacter psychrophilus]